jgi:two-component system phosphate regulon sensor histidine kinase PhoR
MNQRLFVVLVILMSLSLVGIIFVQGYWIKTSIDDKEEQFSYSVNQVIATVADKIEKRELQDFTAKYASKLKDSLGTLKGSRFSEIVLEEYDEDNDEIFRYSHGILEEDYQVANTFFEDFDIATDSAIIPNFTSRRKTQVFRRDFESNSYTPVKNLEVIDGLTVIDKIALESALNQFQRRVPVHNRVSTKELDLLLQRELSNIGIDIDFEYGIYSRGLATKVRSRNFKFTESTRYKAPILKNIEGESDYDLIVTFPEKKRFLISSILGMAVLSVIFTIIIIVAYSSALYQLIKQKQISEIKSDFINNMTHEFKTPIATINLALDSLKNPKAFEDVDKVKRYHQMIRDENKRMHAQVENVLRISKLEKNQLNISKDRVEMHDLIEDAITHVALMVENRGGYIKTHFRADRDEVLANEFHFTNVIVNILDNAIKYSPEAPKIDVYTENVKNSIIIKVKDQGAGMSKAVAKRVFEKFYREHTGNIHNVKGHGLGLAYVKSIVDDHHGEVSLESEKNKGSIFYIKLPLI